MSSRHFRKKVGLPSLPPPEDDSEEEYQPQYANQRSLFAGLMANSQSESGSENSSQHSGEEEEDEEDERQAVAAALPRTSENKSNKKIKKKGKGKWRQPEQEMDEVDLSLAQVNFMLGDPEPALAQPANCEEDNTVPVLRLEPKHLRVDNELSRLLGPEEHEPGERPNRQPPGYGLLLKRILIWPNKRTELFNFKNGGITMTKYKEEDGNMYFYFNHDERYQKMHRNFLYMYANASKAGSVTSMISYFNVAKENMHVEALLEISDLWFELEDNYDGALRIANEIVENVVTFMQCRGHPQFRSLSSKVRLEYKYLENRPFHVALLKYVYLLSNKACHRSALEIIKVMFTIDPEDPLAVLSIVDTIAIRAREFEWLIEFIEYFDEKQDALLLYNLRYSYALAHYHVAVKNKKSLADADKHLQSAILAFPSILLEILKAGSIPVPPSITNHVLFAKDPELPGSRGVAELYSIFVKLNWPRWREPRILEWMTKNADKVCKNYDQDAEVRTMADGYKRWRVGDFQVWPAEYLRHVAILSRISKLVLNSNLEFSRPRCGWDPIFDAGVNRYNYKYHEKAPRDVSVSDGYSIYSYHIQNELDVAIAHQAQYPHARTSYMELLEEQLDAMYFPNAAELEMPQDFLFDEDLEDAIEQPLHYQQATGNIRHAQRNIQHATRSNRQSSHNNQHTLGDNQRQWRNNQHLAGNNQPASLSDQELRRSNQAVTRNVHQSMGNNQLVSPNTQQSTANNQQLRSTSNNQPVSRNHQNLTKNNQLTLPNTQQAVQNNQRPTSNIQLTAQDNQKSMTVGNQMSPQNNQQLDGSQNRETDSRLPLPIYIVHDALNRARLMPYNLLLTREFPGLPLTNADLDRAMASRPDREQLFEMLSILQQGNQPSVPINQQPVADNQQATPNIQQQILNYHPQSNIRQPTPIHPQQTSNTQIMSSNIRQNTPTVNQQQTDQLLSSNIRQATPTSLHQMSNHQPLPSNVRQTTPINQQQASTNQPLSSNVRQVTLNNLRPVINNQTVTNNLQPIYNNIQSVSNNLQVCNNLHNVTNNLQPQPNSLQSLTNNREINSLQTVPNSLQSVQNSMQSVPKSLQSFPTSMQSLPISLQVVPNSMQPLFNNQKAVINALQPQPNNLQLLHNNLSPVQNSMNSVPNNMHHVPNSMRLLNNVQVLPNTGQVLSNNLQPLQILPFNLPLQNNQHSPSNNFQLLPNYVQHAPNNMQPLLHNNIQPLINHQQQLQNLPGSNNLPVLTNHLHPVTNNLRLLPNNLQPIPNNIQPLRNSHQSQFSNAQIQCNNQGSMLNTVQPMFNNMQPLLYNPQQMLSNPQQVMYNTQPMMNNTQPIINNPRPMSAVSLPAQTTPPTATENKEAERPRTIDTKFADYEYALEEDDVGSDEDCENYERQYDPYGPYL